MALFAQEQWGAIERVMDQVLDLPPEHRLAFLERTCFGEPELRKEVERLLRGTESADTFLGTPAFAYAASLVNWGAERGALSPGSRLSAYEVMREVGRGGMATVYLAHDHKHHRRVAIKVLNPELAAAVGADRFLREIEIAATLHHPHILPLFDSGAEDGLLYYVMPYIEGESLRRRLLREERLSADDAIRIVREIAGALDYAHRQGVVHRDVKPENILLQDGQAIIADFGIARAIDSSAGDSLTETGPGIGTPAYMSPEQASSSNPLDGRTDIYALGCVLYEMLVGQPPFTASSAQQLLARHAVDPVPSLRRVGLDVAPAVEQAIMIALAKLPADRFSTARDFAEALAQIPVADAPVPQSGSARAVVTSPSRLRHSVFRVWALLVAGGMVVIAVAVAAGALLHRDQPLRVDGKAVAVAPFRVVAADSSLQYLREGMVDLLAAKLSGTAALRPIDPRTLLSAWHRANGAGDLPEGQALAVATRLGAGRLVEGAIVGGPSRLVLTATVLSTPSGKIGARASAEGPPDSLARLVDQLAARLLALGAGEDEQRLVGLSSVSLPSLRAYLDGQALLRRAAYEAAQRRFEAALHADQTFGLAALGVVRARVAAGQDIDLAGKVAWRYRDQLSPRDRAYLTMYLGSRYPAPRGGRDVIEDAQRVVQIAPDSPEGWHIFGASLYHLGPLIGIPDAHRRASAAFAQLLALDSGYAPAFPDLNGLVAALGDTAAIRRGLRLLLKVDSVSSASLVQQWLASATLGDTARARQALRSDSMVGQLSYGWFQGGAESMLVFSLDEGLDLRDAEAVLYRAVAAAATEAQRANVTRLQYCLELLRGRPSHAPALPSSWSAPRRNAEIVLAGLFAQGDSEEAVLAAAALERDLTRLKHDQPLLARYAAGQYALASNRLGIARRAAASLQGVHGSPPDSVFTTRLAHAYALILEAQLAARSRSPSAPDLLRHLDSMLVNPLSEEMASFGNLVDSRLHEARGELPAALAAVRRRNWGGPLFLPYVTYHREEGRLAALTGDTTGATQAYRRYLALRGDAEPRLQPEVHQVRAEMAALDRAGTSR